MSDIASAVERARAYLGEHPDEARYRDSLARAVLAEGLRVEVTGPGGESTRTDMPAGIGGSASAPSPGWYLRAAAASCVAALIGIRAATLGIELPADAVEVVVDSESDDRGILGIDDGIPAGALSMKVAVTFAADTADHETLDAVARWALDHCPVTDTVSRSVPIELEVR
jgi:uncharacterized OsmC-like protein